jgi:DNA-binding transcriptional ArsR family regulator
LPEDIYEAISHPTRRAIVKALGERGHMTFTELMEAANVKDTGTMTFHLRKLSALVTRNASGEYELTELGRRAYEAIKMIEGQGAAPAKEATGPSAPAGGAKEEGVGLLIISNRVNVDIDRALLEDAKAQGRRVLVRDCAFVKVLDDVDENLVKEALEGIESSAFVEAPKRLSGVLNSRMSYVAFVSFKDHVEPSSSFIGLEMTALKDFLPAALLSSLKSGLLRGLHWKAKRTLVYSSPLKAYRSVKLDVEDSELRLTRGEGKVEFYSYDSSCKYDVSEDNDELAIKAKDCEVELSLQPGATSLELSAEDSDVKVDYGGLSRADVEALDSNVRLSLDDMGESELGVRVDDSFAALNIAYGELRGRSKISAGAENSSLNIEATVKENARVTPVIKSNEDSAVSIEVDSSLSGGEGEIVLELSSSDSHVKAKFSRG